MTSALVRKALAAARFIAIAFTLLFVLVHIAPISPWYTRLLTGPWDDPDGDILIVLTAEMQRDGLIGRLSYWRAVYAIRAYRSGHFRAVVVSGGNGGGPLSLARAVGDFLIAYGIPREAVYLEERSTSTRENAMFTKAMIEKWPGKKVLLTSDYHMYRAVRSFRKAGLEVSPRPIPDVLKGWNSISLRWMCFQDLTFETAKIIRYYALGWI